MMGKIQNGRHKSQKIVYFVKSRLIVVLEYIIFCLIYMLYFIFDIHLIMTIQNSSWPTKSKMVTQEIIGNSRRVKMSMKLQKKYISKTYFKYIFIKIKLFKAVKHF